MTISLQKEELALKENPEIVGVVLASGQSVRMGKPKLLLTWKGQPLIEHLLNKTALFPFKQIRMVIPDQNENLKQIVASYECHPIHNTLPRQGMGHSLALAFQSLPPSTDAAIILLGDQPTLCTDDIRNVWKTFERLRSEQSTCPKTIIQVRYRDGKVGHPILFSVHFFDELRALKGDKGGKDIIQRNHRFLYQCSSENVYPNDIDTPDDYEQLLLGTL